VPVTALGGELVVGFDRPRLERIIARLRPASARRPAGLGAAVKDAPGGGALVGVVHPGTPAAQGGLRPGDVIVAVDRSPVVDTDALTRLLQVARLRGSVTLSVRRADALVPLHVPFGSV